MKHPVLNRLSIAGIYLYFLILMVERALALIFSFELGEEYALTSGSVPAIVFYLIAAIGFFAGLILFIKPAIGMAEALKSKTEYDFKANAKDIVLSSMVFLFSGMMHTGLTIAPVQFVAYGFLILSMLTVTIEACLDGVSKKDTISSLVYLVFFSMAIPVCYLIKLEGAISTFFYVSEIVAVFALIGAFGCLLYGFYKKGVASKHPAFPLLVLVLDALVVGLKWSDEINFFVLIFLVLTPIAYLVSLFLKDKKE